MEGAQEKETLGHACNSDFSGSGINEDGQDKEDEETGQEEVAILDGSTTKKHELPTISDHKFNGCCLVAAAAIVFVTYAASSHSWTAVSFGRCVHKTYINTL